MDNFSNQSVNESIQNLFLPTDHIDSFLAPMRVVANVANVLFAIFGFLEGAAVFLVYNFRYSPNASETIITLYSITDVTFVLLK